jgi:hypothetical protein
MNSLYAFKYKCFRSTCHRVAFECFGITYMHFGLGNATTNAISHVIIIIQYNRY